MQREIEEAKRKLEQEMHDNDPKNAYKTQNEKKHKMTAAEKRLKKERKEREALLAQKMAS